MSIFSAFDGLVVRAAKPEWAYAPTSGEGAARHGGRFNPKGMAALYTSLDLNTSAREVRFSLNVSPYTFYYLHVRSPRIVDARDLDVLKTLGAGESDLACLNWESEMHRGQLPASHAFALELLRQGAQGMLVRSFAPGATEQDVNLVLWAWEEVSGDEAAQTAPDVGHKADDAVHRARVRVLERDRLPLDRSSWKLERIKPRAKDVDLEAAVSILRRAPDLLPEAGDELPDGWRRR